MLLSTSFIDEHIFAFVPDEQIVTVQEPTPFAIVKQHEVSAYVFFTKENTQNEGSKTLFEAKDDQIYTVHNAKLQLFEHLPAIAIIVKTKISGLLFFNRDPYFFNERCPPARGIVEAIHSPPWFVLVTNTSRNNNISTNIKG